LCRVLYHSIVQSVTRFQNVLTTQLINVTILTSLQSSRDVDNYWIIDNTNGDVSFRCESRSYINNLNIIMFCYDTITVIRHIDDKENKLNTRTENCLS